MKAKELRIGNYVIYEGEVQRFTPRMMFDLYNMEALAEKRFDQNVSPVLLTEEWLFKLGFEKFNNKSFALEASIYTVELIRNHWHLLFRSNHVIAQPFKYVHQLQNLHYCLTGEELELQHEE